MRLILGWLTGGWSWVLEILPVAVEFLARWWREVLIIVLAVLLSVGYQLGERRERIAKEDRAELIEAHELELAAVRSRSANLETNLQISRLNQAEAMVKIHELEAGIFEIETRALEIAHHRESAVLEAVALRGALVERKIQISEQLLSIEDCQIRADRAAELVAEILAE